jgi:hypothetical protein
MLFFERLYSCNSAHHIVVHDVLLARLEIVISRHTGSKPVSSEERLQG